MSKFPNLQVEVQEPLRRIIVTMPRTAYDATFGLVARGLCLLSGFGPDDRKASIASHEFVVMARTAATDKARELGWPTEGERRATLWTDRQLNRRW
jgi:hypothetical protein